MKRITDIQLKEIRGGGSRKNVGTCARLIGGGAAWGAVKGAGKGVAMGVPIGAGGGAVLGANMGAIRVLSLVQVWLQERDESKWKS